MAKATTTTSIKTKSVRKIVITAPGGPRRRAGYSFGPHETAFPAADFESSDGEKVLEAWRADPLLKIDVRVVDEPDTEDQDKPQE